MDVPKFEEIFETINKYLKVSGISDGSPLGIQFYILYFCVCLILVEESMFFVFRISSAKFLELTALAPCLGIGVLCTAKFAAISRKRQQMFQLISCLNELYNEILVDSHKTQLVRHEIIQVKSLTKYYFVLNWILIWVYNFSAPLLILYMYLVLGKLVYILPYSVLVPFSTDIWYTWLIVYLHSIACGFIAVLYFTTVDTLYCNLTCLVCCNFAIISDEIENLTPSNVHSLSGIIKRHQYILSLSEVLEDIFTAPNLFNVLVGSIEICALGFNIMGCLNSSVVFFLCVLPQNSVIYKPNWKILFVLERVCAKAGDWSQMPVSILFLTSVLLQILVMSVFGENIIRQSQKVGESAFLCEWYKMELKYKKMILMIITRSQKPQRLTAYKFSTISYGSFTKIISTSWSYFTILRTIYKPSEVSLGE